MILYFKNGVEFARHEDGQGVPASAYPGSRAIALTQAQVAALPRVGEAPPAGDPDRRPCAEPAPSPAMLASYAASLRYAAETAGIVVDGVAVATDRASQSTIIGAVLNAQFNPQFTTRWKDANGRFSEPLNAAKIIAIGQAVTSRVADCFGREAEAVAAISADAPKLTTFAKVEKFFAGL